MNPLQITLFIATLVMVLFLSGRIRPDVVALLAALALGVTGVLTAEEVLSGFSRSAVIAIMAIYIIAEGLQRSGVADQIGRLILRLGGTGERKLLVVVTLSAAFLSLFMNNIAAGSVLLPAVSSAARKSNVNPARLMMPLAFGTILGGMATLLTSTNIVVSGLLREAGQQGFGLLDFAPLGIPLVAAGVIYLALIGPRWLPAHTTADHWGAVPLEAGELARIYRLDERLLRARLPGGSGLIGRTLAESQLRQNYHLNLVAIERPPHAILDPAPQLELHLGDILLLAGRPDEISPEQLRPILELLPADGASEKDLDRSKLVEAVLAPRSALIGQTLRSAHFREKYDLNVIAIWRSGRPIRTELSDLPLQFGDALLLQVRPERFGMLHAEPDLILLNGELSERTQTRQSGRVLLILAVTLATAALNLFPVGLVMLGGALALVLSGVLTMDRAYQVVDWKTVFLIAGMFPLSIALTKTGAAAELGNRLVAGLGPAGPLVLLAGIALIAILMAQVMNSVAVAAVMGPIAIGAAVNIGADPRAMAMGVALAASMTFLTPLGHPVNLLVMGPGGYRVRDYFKIGFPLTILLFVVLLGLIPFLWPLTGR